MTPKCVCCGRFFKLPLSSKGVRRGTRTCSVQCREQRRRETIAKHRLDQKAREKANPILTEIRRQKHRDYLNSRYRSDPEFRTHTLERQNKWTREKYAASADFREQTLARNKAKGRDYFKKYSSQRTERYQSDPSYRSRVLDQGREPSRRRAARKRFEHAAIKIQAAILYGPTK